MGYEGFNKMIDRITDDKRPHPDEISPLEEKIQDEAAADRQEAINVLAEEMSQDADYIADALLADNELASDVGEILADLSTASSALAGCPATETLAKCRSIDKINVKLTAALRDMAVKELEES